MLYPVSFRKEKALELQENNFLGWIWIVLQSFGRLKWLVRIRQRDFKPNNQSHSRRPSNVNEDARFSVVKNKQKDSPEDIANCLKIDISIVFHHLKRNEFVPKLDTWVPRSQTGQNKLDHVSVGISLLLHHKKEPFLDRSS